MRHNETETVTRESDLGRGIPLTGSLAGASPAWRGTNFWRCWSVPLIMAIFLGATVLVLWYQSQQQRRRAELEALERARYTSRVLSAFREHYSETVFRRFQEHPHSRGTQSIPLPATLTLDLGAKINAQGGQGSVALYSPYPFPRRKPSGGLRDEFAKRAWRALRSAPDQPFYETQHAGGQPKLRYATADVMQQSCVECHNAHPDSPRTDWRVGEVRGVLEVTVPLQRTFEQMQADRKEIAIFVFCLTGLALFTSSLVVTALRQDWSRIEHQTAALEAEVDARASIEADLRQKLTELEGLNRELNAFACLAAGREERLMELKREVNRLAVQANVAVPYPVLDLSEANP